MTAQSTIRRLYFTSGAFITAALVSLASCVTKSTVPGSPTNALPVYIVSPSLGIASNIVQQVAQAVAPAVPAGEALAGVAAGIFALVGAASAALARHKSQVAAEMAKGIVQAGPLAVQTVLDSAARGAKLGAVSELLNQNTPPPQAPGSQRPT